MCVVSRSVRGRRSAKFAGPAGRRARPGIREGHGILGLLIVDAEVLRLPDLREHPDSFGFPPHHPSMCFFDGPVDSAVTDDIAHDLLATLREALANIARHAGATQVDVDVAVTDQLVLRVVDDGVGPPARQARRGHGLKNMEARATNRGGTFALRAGASRGSVLEWKVPLL